MVGTDPGDGRGNGAEYTGRATPDDLATPDAKERADLRLETTTLERSVLFVPEEGEALTDAVYRQSSKIREVVDAQVKAEILRRNPGGLDHGTLEEFAEFVAGRAKVASDEIITNLIFHDALDLHGEEAKDFMAKSQEEREAAYQSIAGSSVGLRVMIDSESITFEQIGTRPFEGHEKWWESAVEASRREPTIEELMQGWGRGNLLIHALFGDEMPEREGNVVRYTTTFSELLATHSEAKESRAAS